MTAPPRFRCDTPLSESKNYIDLRDAVLRGVPRSRNFLLIESIAGHVAGGLLAQDKRIRQVEVKIVKLAISFNGEEIGMTLRRVRPERAA